MKKFILTFFVIAVYTTVYAQEFEKNLNEAKTAYNSGDLENTRFALQQSLIQINISVGKEILAILPADLQGMKSNNDNDEVTGNNLGFAGLYVSRYYENESDHADIELITDSPILAGVNAILAMPFMVGSADENQKRIKVHGYKALLEKSLNEKEEVKGYTVQIPVSSSLLTLNVNGPYSEYEVIAMANSIPVPEIVKLIQ